MAFGSKDVGGDGDGGIAGTAESSAESLFCNVVEEGSGDVSREVRGSTVLVECLEDCPGGP